MINPDKHILQLDSWEKYISHVSPLSKNEKGDYLERLTQLILTTKPEYKSILKNVWWPKKDNIPKKVRDYINLPSTDVGIDLIAETIRGEYWAIQCKFQGQKKAPTYKELSTFVNLANNYCKNISLALLVHTGEKGVMKRKLLGEKYTEIGLDFWISLNQEDWKSIHKKLKGQSSKPFPRKPRPHQEKAIEKANKHYNILKESRGRLIMPCGTGKSLTAFWIAKTLKAKNIIIAVPSLSLIKQSLEDWTKEFIAINEKPTPEWLVVCSDESTGKLEKDEFVSDTYSLGIPTTTNIDSIVHFLKLKNKGRKIIFTTYQSSDRLAEAAQKINFQFHFCILDESHKTVGVKSKTFSTLLSDNNIRINKRMFMTATERLVKGKNDDVYSMDNESIYGKQIFRLSFKDAIHSIPPIICDYKIITITVTNAEIQNLINKNKLITDKDKKLEEQESQSLAAAIALRKATTKFGIKHAISFHRSISSANNFAILNTKFNNSKIDNIKLNTFHISSKKSAGERVQLMNDFIQEPLALITNARCLNEGVDIPAIDCVLFADPKQSVVDIVQAAGRALRPYPGKKFGYIMLPLVVPDGLNFQEFCETGPFRQVSRTIAALSTQDERIVEEFRIIDTGKIINEKRIIIEGNVPIGFELSISNFVEKVNAKFWEKVSTANWKTFADARNYIHSLKLLNTAHWKIFCNSESKPLDIPVTPDRIYKYNGWVNWGDWLGSGTISTSLRKYRTFNEARKYSHSLKLKSSSEWINFCKSGKTPIDIPASPFVVYKNKGWVSWGDWLGTGYVATKLKEYRSFKEARKFARSLKLKDGAEWKIFCKTKNKPTDIPANPNTTYFKKGWISMGDWLGTRSIANTKRNFKTFPQARHFAQSLNLKKQSEWNYFCKSLKKPIDIPSNPQRTYRLSGWISWGDWLGTKTLASTRKEFSSFIEARKYSRSLKLKSAKDWLNFCDSGKKPINIPASPDNTYKNKGWVSWGDWLGTGNKASLLNEYRDFKEAKIYARALKLKSVSEWRKFCKSGKKPDDIPSKPYRTYKTKGWTNWGEWLGTGTVATLLRKYRTYEEARNYVHKLKLKNVKEWSQFCNSGKKPDNIPAGPSSTYKNKGWISWSDWLRE